MARPDVAAKFTGLLNGLDVDLWDPATDPSLPANYDAGTFREGKRVCKEFVQRGLGLAVDPSTPLVICVTRLVPQKGLHLIKRALIHTCRDLGGQFVLLGTGHADGEFKALNETDEFGPSSRSSRIMLLYSEDLAHQLYGAADAVIVPSLFEPCGERERERGRGRAKRWGGKREKRETFFPSTNNTLTLFPPFSFFFFPKKTKKHSRPDPARRAQVRGRAHRSEHRGARRHDFRRRPRRGEGGERGEGGQRLLLWRCERGGRGRRVEQGAELVSRRRRKRRRKGPLGALPQAGGERDAAGLVVGLGGRRVLEDLLFDDLKKKKAQGQ